MKTINNISSGLSLGVALCQLHVCRHCRTPGGLLGHAWTQLLQESGLFFLSCLYQCSHPEGYIDCKKFNLIWNPEASHNQMARRPDGVMLILGRYGHALVWYVTSQTPLPPHMSLAGTSAGNVVNETDHHMRLKHGQLEPSYIFIPLAIETSGALGSEEMAVLWDLGK